MLAHISDSFCTMYALDPALSAYLHHGIDTTAPVKCQISSWPSRVIVAEQPCKRVPATCTATGLQLSSAPCSLWGGLGCVCVDRWRANASYTLLPQAVRLARFESQRLVSLIPISRRKVWGLAVRRAYWRLQGSRFREAKRQAQASSQVWACRYKFTRYSDLDMAFLS